MKLGINKRRYSIYNIKKSYSAKKWNKLKPANWKKISLLFTKMLEKYMESKRGAIL